MLDHSKSTIRAAVLALAAALATAAAAGSDPTPSATTSAAAPAAATPADAGPAAGPAPSPAAAEMLKSMREKGMLSEDEYQELYRRQAKYEVEHEQANQLPGWLRDWTFGGDLRLRFERRDFGGLGSGPYVLGKQNINLISNNAIGREDRMRLRLRVGAEKRVYDGLTVGFRVTTSQPVSPVYGSFFNQQAGGVSFATPLTSNSDPRSENVTLGDFFSSKSIWIDRAYVRYQPDFAPTLTAIAGKFANPFVSRHFGGDFIVWDNDINPEGGALTYHFDLVPEQLWFDAAGAAFTIQEQSTITVQQASTPFTAVPVIPIPDQQNPFLLGIQGGLTGKPLPWLLAGVRTSYYDIQHIGTSMAAAMQDLGNGGAAIEHNPLQIVNGTGTGKSGGRLHEIVVDAYLTFTPWGERFAITPFGQWMSILNAKSEDNGWSVGFDFGSESLVKLTVMYASVPRNATVALFTDSDLFEGFTNAQGWYVSAQRALWPGVKVRGAYFFSEVANQNCHAAGRDGNSDCDTATQNVLLDAYRRTTLDRNRWQLDFIVDF
jgi:hypothetical protein